MDSYLNKRTGTSKPILKNISGGITNLSKKIVKINYSLPKELSDYEVHVEEKKPGLLARLFGRRSQTEKEEIAQEIKEEPEDIKEEMEVLAEDYEELNQAEEDIEARKISIMQKFVNLFKAKPKEEISQEEVDALVQEQNLPPIEEQLDEAKMDLKHISKITLGVMEQLPKRKRDIFKDSTEFASYKETLQKYGFVKGKE